MRLKVLHPAFIRAPIYLEKRLAPAPECGSHRPHTLSNFRGGEGKEREGKDRGRGGEGNEGGEGVEEKGGKGSGKEGERRQRGGEGKGVPLIALYDKYHPRYNLNVGLHGMCVILIRG